MKKILLSLALAAAIMPAMANDYTDDLQVSVNGVGFPSQKTTITVDRRTDGAYDFKLKNFSFAGMNIGDLNLDSVPGVEQDGVVYLAATRKVGVTIMFQKLTLPITLRGELLNNASKLYASMDIPVQALSQNVSVLFGNGGYQIPNSGFEDYHTEVLYNLAYDDDWNVTGWSADTLKSASVPNAWHSFMDASGYSYDTNGNYYNNPAIIYLASAMVDPHTYISDEKRPGSAGSHSAKLIARNAFIAIANGTMTTGRMNTGSTNAADVANHAWLDMDSTGTDTNGDPFYTVMNGRPDSLTVWVKYGQATPNADHPYATVSAVITDGTYYQEPDTNVYNNVYAIARNNTIESTNGEWKRLAIPFDVKDNSVKGKAILVTVSTNADAGQGSDGDSILVDDINLVYNDPQNVNINFSDNAVTVGDADATVTYDGANGPIIVKDFRQEGNDVVATVTVYNGDLTKQIAQATHTFANATTGISKVVTDGAGNVSEVYDLSGRRVEAMQHGNVYIVRTADGKTVKVLK